MKARDLLIESANRLFGEAGFDRVSTREIADHAGVNLGLIHYYFGSKEGLYDAVLGVYYEQLLGVLMDAMQEGGGLHEKVGRVLDAYVDFLAEHRAFSRLLQREATDPRRSDQIRDKVEPLLQSAIQLMHELFPASREGILAAEHVLVSVYGMVITYFTYSDLLGKMFGTNPMSEEELQIRKLHLRRMVYLMLCDLEGEKG